MYLRSLLVYASFPYQCWPDLATADPRLLTDHTLHAGPFPDAPERQEPSLRQGPQPVPQDAVCLPLLHLHHSSPGDPNLYGHPHHLYLGWTLPRSADINCDQLDDCLHCAVLLHQVLCAQWPQLDS